MDMKLGKYVPVGPCHRGPQKYVDVEHFRTSPELFTIVTRENFLWPGPAERGHLMISYLRVRT